MEEMIKTLIDDGWDWVARNVNATTYVFRGEKPTRHLRDGLFDNIESLRSRIPSCLFPEITFENSPVELKTLLVDDDEEDKEQKEIKQYLDWGFTYLVKTLSGDVIAIKDGEEKDCVDVKYLDDFVSEFYEKVYLKDLLKKSKVKKSVWLAVDKNGVIRIANEKPIRGDGGIWVDERGYAVHDMSKHTNLLPVSWEDEPKQITIEVEE